MRDFKHLLSAYTSQESHNAYPGLAHMSTTTWFGRLFNRCSSGSDNKCSNITFDAPSVSIKAPQALRYFRVQGSTNFLFHGYNSKPVLINQISNGWCVCATASANTGNLSISACAQHLCKPLTLNTVSLGIWGEEPFVRFELNFSSIPFRLQNNIVDGPCTDAIGTRATPTFLRFEPKHSTVNKAVTTIKLKWERGDDEDTPASTSGPQLGCIFKIFLYSWYSTARKLTGTLTGAPYRHIFSTATYLFDAGDTNTGLGVPEHVFSSISWDCCASPTGHAVRSRSRTASCQARGTQMGCHTMNLGFSPMVPVRPQYLRV
jgi:hypothetical protein